MRVAIIYFNRMEYPIKMAGGLVIAVSAVSLKSETVAGSARQPAIFRLLEIDEIAELAGVFLIVGLRLEIRIRILEGFWFIKRDARALQNLR